MKDDDFEECLKKAIDSKQIWQTKTRCYFKKVFEMSNPLSRAREMNERRWYEIMKYLI